ncbi:MAG: hypothetical protein AVDCRST_MAG05-756, partial [uncultured Rubrobacteraceae bacterium]
DGFHQGRVSLDLHLHHRRRYYRGGGRLNRRAGAAMPARSRRPSRRGPLRRRGRVVHGLGRPGSGPGGSGWCAGTGRELPEHAGSRGRRKRECRIAGRFPRGL